MHDPAGIFLGDVQKAAKNFTFYAKKEERLCRGSVRKRRRAGAPFARLHRQTASTTTKGAGVFPPCGKMGPGLVRNRPGGPRSGVGALLPRPQPLRRFSLHPHQKGRQAVAPRNFEEKNKKAVLQAICLQDRFLRFMRQKFGASPPFSYVTPALPPSFLANSYSITAPLLAPETSFA